MSTREERTIEVTVISANDLKKVNTFGKQKSYVVAYVYSNNKKSTDVDNQGDLNPTWNSKLILTADEQFIQQGRAYLTLEIYSHGTFGSKLVGASSVCLSDIAKEGKGGSSVSAPQYMALEVRRSSGKTKGVLNLSIALGEIRTVQSYQPRAPAMYCGQGSGYPGGGQGYRPQGYPPQYPPQYGAPQYAPQYYPQQQPGYYPQQQGYPQQGYYPQQQAPRRQGFGGGGLGGAGLGLGAGLLGGLLVGDAIGNMDNNNDYGGGYDNGGGYDSGGGGGFDGGDGGGFDGGDGGGGF